MKVLRILPLFAMMLWIPVAGMAQDKAEEPKTGKFGAEITEKGALSTNEFKKAIEGKESLKVKFSATINQCCRKKGCWMTVDLGDGQEMRVTFKDYGFFVPTYADGKVAIMEGEAKVTTTSVDDLRHLAEDAGKSKDEIAAITEPKTEWGFVADGVIIKEP